MRLKFWLRSLLVFSFLLACLGASADTYSASPKSFGLSSLAEFVIPSYDELKGGSKKPTEEGAKRRLSKLGKKVAVEKLYPEEKNSVFHIKRDKLQLDMTPLRRTKTKTIVPIKETIQSIGDKLANNIILGEGRIDVTYQVRRGTRQAIKDTFTGYAEMQRRKTAEELLNANYVAHHMTSTFLLSSAGRRRRLSAGRSILDLLAGIPGGGVIANVIRGGIKGAIQTEQEQSNDETQDTSETDKPGNSSISDSNFKRGNLEDILYGEKQVSLIQVAVDVLSSDFVQKATAMFIAVSRALFLLGLMFLLFTRLSHSGFNFNYVISEPLAWGIGLWLLLNNIALLFDIAIFALLRVHYMVQDLLDFSFSYSLVERAADNLKDSWLFIATDVGYLPIFVLTVLNSIAHLVVYFYIVGLLLYLVLGKIFSPIWLLFAISDSTRQHTVTSFINWLRVFLILIFIPVLYMLVYLIADSFTVSQQHFLNIILSMSSMLLVPVLSSALLSRGSGLAGSVVSGYEFIIDNFNASLSKLRNVLETTKENHNFQQSYIANNPVSDNRNDFRQEHSSSNNLGLMIDKLRMDTINAIGKKPLGTRHFKTNKLIQVNDKQDLSRIITAPLDRIITLGKLNNLSK